MYCAEWIFSSSTTVGPSGKYDETYCSKDTATHYWIGIRTWALTVSIISWAFSKTTSLQSIHRPSNSFYTTTWWSRGLHNEKVTSCLLFASINLPEENQKHIIVYTTTRWSRGLHNHLVFTWFTQPLGDHVVYKTCFLNFIFFQLYATV